MRYTKPVPVALTARITKKQRKMLEEIAQDLGGSLSDALRRILQAELDRRSIRQEELEWRKSKVPARRP